MSVLPSIRGQYDPCKVRLTTRPMRHKDNRPINPLIYNRIKTGIKGELPSASLTHSQELPS
jgi:hypothetical protein